MKQPSDFWDDSYSVNFDYVLYPKKSIHDINDVIAKAYYAGYICHFGSLIVFGTGAERGTYGRFANVKMSESGFITSREALTYFTDIYSMASRNQGISNNRKRTFWLSQRQEIFPLLEYFGLRLEFDKIWIETEIHDKINDLNYEWQTKGKIHHYETRSKLTTIVFKDREMDIMESVSEYMLTPVVRDILYGHDIKNHVGLLQEAFIEGTRGLELTQDDIITIFNGNGILTRYRRAA